MTKEKELFDCVYQWGRVGIVTDENCPTFQKLVEELVVERLQGVEKAINLVKNPTFENFVELARGVR